jgi:hypothetical protein
MRIRLWVAAATGVMLIALAGMYSSVQAAGLRDPRQVTYAGKRIWVRLAPGQITRLVLPEPLTQQRFALSPRAATLSTDPSDPRQLVIEALEPEAEAQLSVSTTRQVYVVVLRLATAAADSVVTVSHPPAPPPRRHPNLDPKAAMRTFWRSQWWGRSFSPDIRVEPVEGLLSRSEGQETRYVAYQRGLGFYGWTLRLTNTSKAVQVLDIESLRDASGRLLSVMPQGSISAYPIGHLAPGQSLRLHLTYEEGRP